MSLLVVANDFHHAFRSRYRLYPLWLSHISLHHILDGKLIMLLKHTLEVPALPPNIRISDRAVELFHPTE